MKTIVLFLATLAAAAAVAPADACPADTSLEHGRAAVASAHPPVPARHCSTRVAGNPKLVHLRRKSVRCESAFATRPAKRRDAA